MLPAREQLNVPGTSPLLAPPAECLPVIKWPGGKRWITSIIGPGVHARLATTGGRYIEPFLGGAAMALHLGLPCMILSDVCRPLITMYQAIRVNPDAVDWALQVYIARGTDRGSFETVRNTVPPSHSLAAARMIYLNKLAFNGLYRENRSGEFNVSYGDGRKVKFPNRDELRAASRALAGADIRLRDCIGTINVARAGDVIYADPPYYGTFTSYTSGDFRPSDQARLAVALRRAHERGAVVLSSNSDHEAVRDLYSWAFVTPLAEHHGIGATADRRGKKPAVLIVSDQTILGT